MFSKASVALTMNLGSQAASPHARTTFSDVAPSAIAGCLQLPLGLSFAVLVIDYDA